MLRGAVARGLWLWLWLSAGARGTGTRCGLAEVDVLIAEAL